MSGTIMITGATGFVGSALLERLQSDGLHRMIATVRNQPGITKKNHVNTSFVNVGDLSGSHDWSGALSGVGIVVHAAARAHMLNEPARDPLAEFRRTNVNGTLQLAKQAAEKGVSRFVFISSIGVNGNNSFRPFTADDVPNPSEPYAISKYEAEKGLRDVAAKSGMEVVIIRPPLVYGPNAPGNFHRLMSYVRKGVPLPLGAIYNQRSFVALDNLVDLIVTCVEHPAAANQTLLVSDGEDLSTTEFLRRIANSLGMRARLLPVPQGMLESVLMLLGKNDLAQRLCGSLQVDITKTRDMLSWHPPLSVDEQLLKIAKSSK